jgi:NAD(P)-dependent dehydrogenase (short-subunit alcohol dehydrogenase family)
MTARSILITGCSSGIGYAAAKTLKTRGWRVLATARKPEDRARLEKELGVETIEIELGDLESVRAGAKEALQRTGHKLDALYNNAAYGVIGAMEDVPGELLRRHLEINVIGTHELTRAVIPAMRARGQGRIVTCSSVLGLVSGPYRGPYCASKFAVEAMTDAMRYELAGTGIHVSLIEPGPIQSEFRATMLATFRATIDVANSPHREAYAKRMQAMDLGTEKRFEFGPGAVVTKLIHALESPRPKVRYRVTPHTHITAFAKRVLPSRILDAILTRS